MSCIKDVERAILNKAFELSIDNRPTFKRVGLNEFEVNSGNSIFKNDGNQWTHLTNSDELIRQLVAGKPFIGRGEDTSNFTKDVSTKRFNITKENATAPYFQKGKFYGEATQKYLIVANGDNKFTPNINKANAQSLEESKGVGVLNPEHRESSNFTIYKRNSKGQYELLGSSKATTNSQALAIAKNTALRISQQFNGHIVGELKQDSPYDPVRVALKVNPNYVQYVYNKQLSSQNKTDNSLQDEHLFSVTPEEQDQINANTGANTNAQLNPDEYANPAVGYYSKFIQHKEELLNDFENRLKKINQQLNSKRISADDLKTLNKAKRLLNIEINGLAEAGKKGLKQEIKELRTLSNENAVGYYVEKDLSRLDKLADSNNIDELNEATRLIEFYEAAGTFEDGVDNPFFEQEDIFLNDENDQPTTDYKINDEDRAVFAGWKDRAIGYKNIVSKKFRELSEQIVNTDIAVKNTYGNKQFGFDELTYADKGLKDTSWIDMWTMDITNGIVRTNGLLPQVIFNQLAMGITAEKKYAVEFEERVNKNHSKVLQRLKEIGQTLKSKGIDGVTQGIYSIFLERNGNNQLTGGYAYKYNSTYENERAKAANHFSNAYNDARSVGDFTARQEAFKKAFREKRTWTRANNHIIEFNKVPEIINDAEFGEYDPLFDRTSADAYKTHIISVIGQKEYDKQVADQKRLLRKYVADKQDVVDTLMEEQGINDAAQLSEDNKLALKRWTINNSPFHGINDYFEVKFDEGNSAGNFQKYNVFVPRKTQSKWEVSADGKRYNATDTTTPVSTNYYNHEFEEHIENDPILYEFHELLAEAMDYVKEVAPADIAKNVTFNYLSSLDKTTAEIITDKNNEHNILLRVVPAFKQLWEKIRLNFGVNKQSEISYEKLDSEGKRNYKVNDAFLRDNAKSIQDRITIETIRMLQAFNFGTGTKNKIINLKKFTTRKLTEFNTDSLVLLADYLGVDISLADIQAKKLGAIEARTGKDVQIHKVIEDYSTHEIVKEQSFDLAKIIKHFTNMAALYNARSQAMPKLALLKKYYDNIKDPKRNNMGKAIFNIPNERNEVAGIRDKSVRQMNDWWERVMLDNHGSEHTKEIGSNKKGALLGKTIYSKEDRKKFDEIQDLLKGETRTVEELKAALAGIKNKLNDPSQAGSTAQLSRDRANITQKIALMKIQDSLGKTRTATAFIDNMLAWVRTMRLGWNLNSAITNCIEGYMSNMMLAATGEYFNPNEIYYAYGVVKHSFVKNITFGKVETGLAKRNRMLMDMFDILMDSKNELQKSSVKTFSDKFESLNPHAMNQRVEYINQSAVMIAMLRSMKLKGKDGTESSVWEAYDNKSNRMLKDNFRTEENIQNWEELTGDQYKVFKEKLRKVIVLGHGNYDELRGMLSKSGSGGKALMMFKTWLPQQLYWRFATQQDDLQTGTIGFKGKYLSYGTGSGALHGMAVGGAFFGPVGMGVGALIGGTLGGTLGKNVGIRKGEDSIGLLQETLVSAKVLAKKMIGMPINTLAGRKLIGTSGKEFDAWIGKRGFTQQDANALKSNMSDIAMQLTFIALILMTKAAFWDDDDDADSKERIAHNLLVNKLMQLSSGASLYVNPAEGHKSTLGSIAIIAYLTDVGKTISAVNEALHGNDTIKSGINAGQSKLYNQFKKTFVPGVFKGGLGFESQASRQFETSPWDKYSKLHIADKRKAMRAELTEEGFTKGEINKELNKELPTKQRLKKAGMTRKEWLEQNAQ